MAGPKPTGIARRARWEAGRAHWIFRRATARLRLRPTFIIIGAARAGTTSLNHYLSKHPAVLTASHKEVQYFSANHDRGRGWYQAQFPLSSRQVVSRLRFRVKYAVGEASPQYFLHPHALQRVHAFDPSMKLIAILRDPVDRAYSHYQMQLRLGSESLSFEEALDREEAMLEGEIAKLYDNPSHWSAVSHMSYIAYGRYAEQIERVLAIFPREQLLVVVSEDLFADPEGVLVRVCSFLQVPERVAKSYPHLAGGGGVFDYEPLDPVTRERLARAFVEPNRHLEELLGRELHWTRPALTPEPALLHSS